MSFTEAAYKILKNSGEYLKCRQLVNQARSTGLLSSTGKTPERTMWTALYSENKRRQRRHQSPRFILKQGLWGLKEWDKPEH